MNSSVKISSPYQEPIAISVVIPTYNSERYIDQTVEETISRLQDLNLDFELLIIDDYSTDETLTNCRSIQKKYDKINLIHLLKNHGQRAASSLGYHLAKGKFVVTMDDDLQYQPANIELLYHHLVNSDKLIACGFSSFTGEKSWYRSVKKLLFTSFNYIFFPRYRNSKYISSFKMYNKEALAKQNIHNIFYFWDIASSNISAMRVLKEKGLRAKSNYTLTSLFVLLSPLIFKTLYKFCLSLALINFLLAIIYNNTFALIAGISALVISISMLVLIYKEKSAHLKINYQEILV